MLYTKYGRIRNGGELCVNRVILAELYKEMKRHDLSPCVFSSVNLAILLVKTKSMISFEYVAWFARSVQGDKPLDIQLQLEKSISC